MLFTAQIDRKYMMYYYSHNISDFNNATRHLGREERSIYRDCIEMCYDTESPLDGTDLERLQRRLLCYSDTEKAALDFILNEFFEEEGGLYMNSRCDREIAIYKARDKVAAKKQEAANERKRRYRDDRRDMFTKLRILGVVPDFNIKMDELRALYSEHYQENVNLSKGDVDGTLQEHLADASGTTKIEPLNDNQELLTNINTQEWRDERFEEFYELYPNKKSRGQAKITWNHVFTGNKIHSKSENPELLFKQIMQGVQLQTPKILASEESFRKYPSTWLNAQNWLDEVAPQQTQSPISRTRTTPDPLAVNAKWDVPTQMTEEQKRQWMSGEVDIDIPSSFIDGR